MPTLGACPGRSGRKTGHAAGPQPGRHRGRVSGPQQLPFYCETEAFGRLGPSSQPDCTAPTVVTYQYRGPPPGASPPLADPAAPPADAATVTVGRHGGAVTSCGSSASTSTARCTSWPPSTTGRTPASGPRRAGGFNGKLVYTFGGGCNVGYHQGSEHRWGAGTTCSCRRGYAVASASLNVNDTNCNYVISAETALMVKEHAIEDLRSGPGNTIGWGGSGGAIRQQRLIAQGYPGIMDGIVPGISFPDAAGLSTVADCRLLTRYFGSTELLAYTEGQREAGLRVRRLRLLRGAGDRFFASRYDADEACPSVIPGAGDLEPHQPGRDPLHHVRAVRLADRP